MACAAGCHPSWRVGTASAQARRWAAQAFTAWSLRRPRVTIVMGLDQHRAQITAEWLDASTGEVSRARIAPAHRSGVRRFVERFRGLELEVAAGGDDRLAIRRGGAVPRRGDGAP